MAAFSFLAHVRFGLVFSYKTCLVISALKVFLNVLLYQISGLRKEILELRALPIYTYNQKYYFYPHSPQRPELTFISLH